jgi:hypothetical protein
MQQHRHISTILLLTLPIIGLVLAGYVSLNDAHQPAATIARLVGRTPSFPVAVEVEVIPVTELAILAADTTLIDSLIQNGNAFAVANNQQVEILSVGSAGIEVRILQGNQAGRTGWAAPQFVQRQAQVPAFP